MEFKKITNFLNITSDNKDLPKFNTKKQIEVYQSEGNYNVNKEIRIRTSMLRSDLFDYSGAFINVKETITVTDQNNAKRNKAVTFKNNAPFINCVSKMNGVKIDNAQDLDVVMPMDNLLEYSKHYKTTTDSLWNYYRDETSNPLLFDSESFKYKNNITENTYNVDLTIIGNGGNLIPNHKYDTNKVGKN